VTAAAWLLAGRGRVMPAPSYQAWRTRLEQSKPAVRAPGPKPRLGPSKVPPAQE